MNVLHKFESSLLLLFVIDKITCKKKKNGKRRIKNKLNAPKSYTFKTINYPSSSTYLVLA